MTRTKRYPTKKIVFSVLLIVAIFGAMFPSEKIAHAQGLGVPILTNSDSQSIFHYLKDFSLDHFAALAAKQILHQLTASVVNWINTGFQGSPAFLTNPEGYFADAADQVTGIFLAGNGALQKLCSPFAIDIRLNLALQQANLGNNARYTCTLSKVIGNAQNTSFSAGIGTNQNGATIGDIASGNILNNPSGLSLNGQSAQQVNDFMDGNFSEGGWQGFIAMATIPQNNAMGAYLMAQDDLQQQIEKKQNSINNDLNRGKGFLSWQSCNDVTSQVTDTTGYGAIQLGLDANQTDQLYQGGVQSVNLGNGSSIQTSYNSSGDIGYKQCTVQTPGSTIAGVLQENLNVPVEELGLANDINAVVNALVTQLLNQALSKGLYSLSSSSNGQKSYTAQIIADATSNNSANSVEAYSRVAGSAADALKTMQNATTTYSTAIGDVSASRDTYQTALVCWQTLQSSPAAVNADSTSINTVSTNIAAILTAVATHVDPLLYNLSNQQTAVGTALSQLQNLVDNPPTNVASTDASSTQIQINESQTYIQNLGTAISSAPNIQSTAAADLKNAVSQSNIFNTDAKKFQTSCDKFKFTYPVATTTILR